MTIVYVGELTVGGALPGAELAASAGIGGIGGALPDILARRDALAAFMPVAVDFAAQLALAEATVSSVSSAIALGLPVPSIDAQLAAVAALVASLLATVEAVNAQLDVVLAFQQTLGAAGVHVYAYTGPLNGLGGDVAAELASGVGGDAGGVASHGVVIVTTSSVAWDALQQVFKVTP